MKNLREHLRALTCAEGDGVDALTIVAVIMCLDVLLVILISGIWI